MKQKYWLVLGVAAMGATQAAACSSNFDSCTDSRTCASAGAAGGGEAGATAVGNTAGDTGESGGPTHAGGADSAGDAGNAGNAGNAGESQTAACISDSDCSDNLACNGAETCQAGQCKVGVPPCPNPDPVHCDAVCTESSPTAACSVRGQDADMDGHFSSACVASPGDDCDDSAPTVYTGAPELCDGIDNNCNSKIDFNDGIAAGGKSITIGTPHGRAAIAWAPDKSVYGILYNDTAVGSAADLYFEEVDQSGTVVLAPKLVNDAGSKSNGNFVLAWGSDQFGALWVTPSYNVYLRGVGSDGNLAAAASHFAVDGAVHDLDLARYAGGNWLAMYAYIDNSDMDYPDSVTVRAVSSAGVSGVPQRITTLAPQSWNEVDDGTNVVLTISEQGQGSSAPSSAGQVLGLAIGSQNLDIAGRAPVPGMGPGGVGIAARGATDADLPNFSVLSLGNTTVCGPVTYADKAFMPSSVVATPKGYLVASGRRFFAPASSLRVQEVFSNCTLGPLFTIEPGPVEFVKIVGSATGFGIAYYDDTAGVSKLRLLGPKYCN